MTSGARKVLRVVRSLFVCALLAVAARAPGVERAVDGVVLVAEVDSASATRAPDGARATIRAALALPRRPSPSAAPDAPGPLPVRRLYLRQRALLL